MSPPTAESSPKQRETPPVPEFPVRKILVCQLRQIGDVLLSTPAIELLARRYPEAQLHVFTEKKCLPMLENNPHIQRVWEVDKKRLPTLLHELAYYRKIAAQGFDLVVDFQQLPRCRWVVAMSGARVKLSFPPPWYTRRLYTHWARPEPAYAAAYKAGVLAPLGITWQGEPPRLYLSESERETGKRLLQSMGLDGKRFISMDTTHRQATRRWPARHFAALMDMLAEAVPDIHFLMSYGPGEENDVRALRAMSGNQNRLALPERMLSLRESISCQEHAVLQLGNCSSPRHMAVALDVPSVTLAGSTGIGWNFPSPRHITVMAKDFMSMPCQNCNKNTCSRQLDCLENLTPELVFPKVMQHLATYGGEQRV